jgi:anti-sigma-K factor RskA
MSTPNELEEVTLALPDLALGMLPAVDAEQLMAIVRLNPRLQAELASLRGANNALASAVAPVVMSPDRKQDIRSRLMARAAGGEAGASDGVTQAATVASPPTLRPEPTPERAASAPAARDVSAPARIPLAYRAAPLLALAATVLFVVSVFRLRDTLQERNDARVALRDATAATTAMSEKLARSDSLVAAMSGANVRVLDLASTQNMAPAARMFWDRVANRWTLVTHDLAPLGAGRTYQLWLVTAKAERISAGTFNTDATGRAVVQATYALAEADLAAIAITEEPEGGSPQPTGTILVAGAATR